jgi:hypothetical protein
MSDEENNQSEEQQFEVDVPETDTDINTYEEKELGNDRVEHK